MYWKKNKQTLSNALGNVSTENDFLQRNNEMEGTHKHRVLKESSTKLGVSRRASEEMTGDSHPSCTRKSTLVN